MTDARYRKIRVSPFLLEVSRYPTRSNGREVYFGWLSLPSGRMVGTSHADTQREAAVKAITAAGYLCKLHTQDALMRAFDSE